MRKFLLCLVSTMLLSSCNFNPTSSDDFSSFEPSSGEQSSLSSEESSGEPSEESSLEDVSFSDISTTPSEPGDEITYEELFNYSNDLMFKLEFRNESIYRLANYCFDATNNRLDMYHPADLTIILNGVSYFYEEVGVRMKGNTSKNSEFVNENGKFSAFVHYKISFKETFDDEEDNDYYIRSWNDDASRKQRKNRRLAGMEKIDLKWNKNYDSTFSRQSYALNCFNDVGLLAQKSNIVKVNVKSETDSYNAYYELLECIDETFISRRFPEDEASGDLYKCTYTREGQASLTRDSAFGSKVGKEDASNNSYPPYDLKTNKKTSDHSTLRNFIYYINMTNDQNDFVNTVDQYLDLDSYIKFEAMAYVIGGPDDHRQNSNNYYLYFSNKTNKAYFIPYDYDRCLGILQDWAIDMSHVPFTTTKKAGQDRAWQDNPLMWRVFLTHTESNMAVKYPVVEEYRNRYNDLCLEYANKYLSLDRFNEFVNNMYNAPSKFDSPDGENQTFEYYAREKLNTTIEYYNNL